MQIDTASGIVNDIPAIRAAIDAAGHPALLMVDCVASLGCMPFEMDGWGVDVAMAGSQKGLMTPPGLAFVAANERAHAAHQKADLRTRYWDWTFRQGQAHYQKYGGTPPQHLLFGLRKALDLLLAEGLEHAARRHALLAEATRQAVGRWAEGRVLDFNVRHAAERANSVTTILMPDRDPRRCSTTAATSAAWSWAWASAICRARRFASRTWATSTRRWCSASSARSRWGWPRSAFPTARAACRPPSSIWGAR